MSQPIIQDTYSVVLNESNNFTYSVILRPPFINKQFCRVLSSNSNTIYSVNFIRPSYYLYSDSNQPEQIDGICVADENIWYEINSTIVDKITVSVYKFSNPKPDSLDLTFQFA